MTYDELTVDQLKGVLRPLGLPVSGRKSELVARLERASATGLGLIQGDSREIENYIPENSVDLVVTSPPYWNIRDYGYDDQIGYKQSYDDYIADMKRVFEGCYALMKDERWLAINIGTVVGTEGMRFVAGDFVRICEEIGFTFRKDIIWNKPRGQTKWQRGGTQWTTNPFPRHFNTNINHEFILLFTKGEVARRGRPEADALTEAEFGDYVDYERPYLRALAYSVWDITPVNSPRLDEKHAAPFPAELPRRVIELFTYPNEVVLDPFAGAGTALRVAKSLHRRFVGVEMSEEYCEIARQRIEETEMPDAQEVLASTAARFSRTPDEQLQYLDNEGDKVESKIRELDKQDDVPSLEVKERRYAKRIKALQKKLDEIKRERRTTQSKLDSYSGEEE